jgi:hypothetical protein
MARLEIELDGTKVTVDNVEPSDIGKWIAAVSGVDVTTPVPPTVQESRPIRDIYYVTSASIPGHQHRVVHYGNGIFECPCQGFAHRGYCSHTTNALNQHRARYGYYASRQELTNGREGSRLPLSLIHREPVGWATL